MGAAAAAAAEVPTPTYDVATRKSLGASPSSRRSLDMGGAGEEGGGRRDDGAGAMMPDYEGDGDHFVLAAPSSTGAVINFPVDRPREDPSALGAVSKRGEAGGKGSKKRREDRGGDAGKN